jgi:hypothetical protein
VRDAGWDPSFTRKSPLFWPIAPAAAALAHFDDWPAPSDLALLFSSHAGPPPVLFEQAAPRPRRGPPGAGPRYDARIALERVVPTRARSWHDLLNALVWATFPRAKLALHTRQHRMIEARLGEDRRLPGERTKQQDAVAMLDEGGVVFLRDPSASCAIVFGHAIYEGLACDGPADVRGAAHVAELDALPADARALVAAADRALTKLFTRDDRDEIGRDDFEAIVVNDALATR